MAKFNLPMSDDEPIGVRCDFRDCSQCCYETEMVLTFEDRKRLIKAGHNPSNFLLNRKDTDGFHQLKNVDGKCYFLSKEGQCTVYTIRPDGCRLYPLILTLDTNEVIVDDDCRERKWFSEQGYHEDQVLAVHSLVSRLLLENEENF